MQKAKRSTLTVLIVALLLTQVGASPPAYSQRGVDHEAFEGLSESDYPLLSAREVAPLRQPMKSSAASGDELWRTYTSANTVRDLAIEGDYVWAATSGGVVRWDSNQGTHMKYTTSNSSLRDNSISAIAIDSAGRKWLGTHGGGVSTFDNTSWRSYMEANGLADNWVQAIAVDNAGQKWFGTNGGVSVFDGANWTSYSEADGLADDDVRAIAIDSVGLKWFGTDQGISVFDGSTWTTYTEADGLADNAVQAVAIDDAGQKWFGTESGVSVFDGITWTTYTEADGLADNDVIAIAIDDAGQKWFGTYQGISVFDGVTWTTYTTADGLADNMVRAIAIDDTGHKWFGTIWGGLSMYDDTIWTTYTTTDGPIRNDVKAIAVDGIGHKWFGTYGGLSVFDGTTWTTYTTADGLAGIMVEAIEIDDAGHMWFATESGVSRFDGSTWTTYTRSNSGLIDNNIHLIEVGEEGRKWFASFLGGVSVFDDSSWTTYTKADGLAGNLVLAIKSDDAGHVWFGTALSGASMFDGSNWTTYTTADGLADNQVTAIDIDDAGHIWFGHGWPGAVTEFDGTEWTTYSSSDGLSGDNVYDIVVDNAGRKWFATNGGVSVFDSVTWTTYTTADGLADNMVTAIEIDAMDRKWFGTRSGVSEFIQAPSVPMLDAVSNPDGDGTYTVDWSRITGAETYTLQEDDNASFSSPTTCYTGSDSQYVIREQSAGTWYYRARASNAAGDSDWSNVESVTVESAPVAAFTGSPTSGNTPLPVDFTDQSTGTITDWSWDFGDGESSTTQNPRHTYHNADHYTVSLTVGGPGGSDTETKPKYILVSEPPTEGDDYESDDTCAQASVIPTDGSVQNHTFHQHADKDWVSFDATAGIAYLIEAQIPADSSADVVAELYDQCVGLPVESQDYAFTPGIRIQFEPSSGGPLYLKLLNHDPSKYGSEVAYQLSIRALDQEPSPGALVLVGGRLRMRDPVQDNIHHVTDAVRQLFLAQGYDDNRITYLATDADLEGWDALPTADNLSSAITDWAPGKVGPERAFTLYLMDHGDYDQFYLDKPGGEWVTPQEVDDWLSQLESSAPGARVNVIVEACHSGSFIDLAQTVSAPGRVVIASTGARNVAWASDDGAVFSDHFVTALEEGQSLYGGFQTARWAVQSAHRDQTPWIDDDGDGVYDETTDGEEAARRGFSFAGTLAGEEWPPYVVQGTARNGIEQGQGVIQAEVRDDEGVRRVWAVVYPPSYEPPETSEELVRETMPTIVLLDQGNDWYGATYTGFSEAGTYRVVIHSEDDDGLEARPLTIEVRTGWSVYLPLVLRRTP